MIINLPIIFTDVDTGRRTPGTKIPGNSTSLAGVSHGGGHSESRSRPKRTSTGRTNLAIVNHVPRKGGLPGHVVDGGGMLMQSQVENVSLLVLESTLRKYFMNYVLSQI